MPTFLDESGDIGVNERSARYYRLVAVSFQEEVDSARCMEDIRTLRQSLGLPADFEFHFAKNSHRQKEAFFTTISNHTFTVASCHYIKAEAARLILTNDHVRTETIRGLVKEMGKLYLEWEAVKPNLVGLNEKIYYDECEDQKYLRTLKGEFGTLVSSRGKNEKLIRSIKGARSRSDPRIQMVDMVCGAVGLYINGDSRYYDHIRSKCRQIIVLP